MTTDELQEFVASGDEDLGLEQNESMTFNDKYASDPRPMSEEG
jgi:hypothetical protein